MHTFTTTGIGLDFANKQNALDFFFGWVLNNALGVYFHKDFYLVKAGHFGVVHSPNIYSANNFGRTAKTKRFALNALAVLVFGLYLFCMCIYGWRAALVLAARKRKRLCDKMHT